MVLKQQISLKYAYIIIIMIIIIIIIIIITKLQKVIWEEGRVAAKVYTYDEESPLVTMARPKFAPKSTPSRVPIPRRCVVLVTKS